MIRFLLYVAGLLTWLVGGLVIRHVSGYEVAVLTMLAAIASKLWLLSDWDNRP